MHHTKRILLRGGLALLAMAGLPRVLLAAVWPQKAFVAVEADKALTSLLGTAATTVTDQINLKVPEIAEKSGLLPRPEI